MRGALDWPHASDFRLDECSTPFGINARGAVIGLGHYPTFCQCSTPFGINTRGTSATIQFLTGANSCSTPFGINARGTALRPDRRPGDEVLNAFRHQCEGHTTDPHPNNNSNARAQRLSASMRGAPPGTTCRSFPHPERCSTPFGINARGTSGKVEWSNLSCDVLNAFRHQCEGTKDPRGLPVDLGVVLNAFRHQCEGHPSTRSIADPSAAVLNAFRHQCEGHLDGTTDRTDDVCAQRLSASMRGAPGRTEPSGTSPTGAQRLSASMRGARVGHAWRSSEVCPVLNAFRHQCEGHLDFASRRACSAVCSTPFGINARGTRVRS